MKIQLSQFFQERHTPRMAFFLCVAILGDVRLAFADSNQAATPAPTPGWSISPRISLGYPTSPPPAKEPAEPATLDDLDPSAPVPLHKPTPTRHLPPLSPAQVERPPPEPAEAEPRKVEKPRPVRKPPPSRPEVRELPRLRAPSPWGLDAQVHYGYGPIDGFIQIPLGGAPGSSDIGRPTFDELGIDNHDFYDVEAGLRRGPYRLYGGIQVNRISTTVRLATDLRSRNQDFLAGERFTTDSRFDWWRFGLQRDFYLSETFTLGARVELISMDLEYDSRNASVRVTRAIQRAGLRLGINGNWQVNDRLSVTGSAGASIPDDSQPQITVFDLLAHLRLTPLVSSTAASLFAGIAYEEIEYEDDQELPNHLDAELGPLGILGLSVSR